MVKVVKFGGSSLASAEQFKKVSDIIHSDDSRRYVVPSAPGKRFPSDIKVTDMLYECYSLAAKGKNYKASLDAIKKRYYEIIHELGIDLSLENEFKIIETAFVGRSGRDYAASRGEYLNGIVLAKYLGFQFIDSAEVIFFDDYGNFDADSTNKALSEKLSHLDYAVIPGFYGSMPNDTIKTFSRGGSDITGSIVAKAVKADMYENWTDVSGVLTVLHEDAIFPVRKEGIPINIRNTNSPEDMGTMIVESTSKKSEYTITGIAGKRGFTAVSIEKDMMNAELGFGRRVLEEFEKNGISFEHMPSGIDTMSVFVNQEEFGRKGRESPENKENFCLHFKSVLCILKIRSGGKWCQVCKSGAADPKVQESGAERLPRKKREPLLCPLHSSFKDRRKGEAL